MQRWGITAEELTEIVAANPLRKMFFESDGRIHNLRKYDNHDRARPGDLEFTYRGAVIKVEVKSLQTATIRKEGNSYVAKFQCDASDRRKVTLPNGESIVTTCLVAGGFDLLAVNLFEFEQRWQFAFARNQDLPRSRYRGYTPRQRRHLLATLVEVRLPLQPPFTGDLFHLLDEIVREQSPSSKTLRSSRRPGSKSDSSARGPA